MSKRINHNILTMLFLLLWVLDSSVGDRLFYVGGLGIYYHLLIMSAIIAVGGLVFLTSPKLGRAQAIIFQGSIMLLPILFPVLWSGIIWIVNLSGGTEIRRGIVSAGYLVFGILAIAATVYTVGSRTPWVYLCSLITANLIIMFRTIVSNGLAPFLTQFAELLSSFAGVTGDIMQAMEIHSITYGLGAYLVYYLIKRRDFGRMRFLMLPALLCYLMGLKRISVLAVVASIILAGVFIGIRRHSEVCKALLTILGICFVIGSLAYVCAVYLGLYDFLESIGFNTNSRAIIYNSYRQYYNLSPLFLGHGTGWSDDLYRNIAEGLANSTETVKTMPHNDYMKMYMEVGMSGFLVWCYLKCNLQVKEAFYFLGARGGVVALALTSYLAITFLTDPTSTQIHVNCAIAGILMGYRLELREMWYEKKIKEKNHRLSELA